MLFSRQDRHVLWWLCQPDQRDLFYRFPDVYDIRGGMLATPSPVRRSGVYSTSRPSGNGTLLTCGSRSSNRSSAADANFRVLLTGRYGRPSLQPHHLGLPAPFRRGEGRVRSRQSVSTPHSGGGWMLDCITNGVPQKLAARFESRFVPRGVDIFEDGSADPDIELGHLRFLVMLSRSRTGHGIY